MATNNDSLIIQVIDQIMALRIKITWCKNHDNILFGQFINPSIINFLYGGHPKIMNIHKNLLGDIPNIFPYQNVILSLKNCIP